jgi:hypothetical protein
MLANNPTCLVVEPPQKCNISVREEYESIGMMVMMLILMMMMMMMPTMKYTFRSSNVGHFCRDGVF